MRILHVVPSYFPAVRYGGPIRSVHGLAAEQVRRGEIVDVFTTNIDGDGELDVPSDRPVEIDGVRVHYFPVSSFRRLCVAPRLQTMLPAQLGKTDIVHLHSVYLWPTYVAARAAHDAGVPYLVAPRGMLVKNLIENKNSFVKKLWINVIEKKTLRHSAGIHVTTEAEQNDLRELGLELSKTYCIPNGVNPPETIKPFSRFYSEIGDSPFVLYVGRLNWKKGLDRLIDAWARIQGDYRLVIAGNDEDGYRSILEKKVTETGMVGRVVFLGEVPDDEKWDLYQRASIFVLPSMSENFGNVVLEAMSVSCPVLVSNGVGLADTVRSAGCGVVCANDPITLAEGIAALLRDPNSKLMGQRGRKIVGERYSWGVVADGMDRVYRRAIAASGESPSVMA